MTSKTGGTKILNHCELCKYFHIEVRQGGRWLETCEVTGEQLVWRCGEFIKSDRCPFKEVKNV